MPDTATLEAPATAVIPETPTGDTPSTSTPEKAQTQSQKEAASAALKAALIEEPTPTRDLAGLTQEQIDNPPGDELEPEPVEETPTDEVIEETPEAKAEREEAEEAAREAEETKKGDPKRIRIRRDKMSDRDFAIIRLMDDQGISYRDAEKRLYGDTIEKPVEPAKAVPQAPTVAELETKLAEARTKREKAAEAMDIPEVNKINDEISDLRESIRDTKNAQASQQQTAQQKANAEYAEAETAALGKIIERYEDANTPGTPLFEEVQKRASALQKSDPSFFRNPRWAISLVTEVATDLDIAPKLKTETAKVEKPVLAAPKKVTRPAISPAPGSSTSAATAQNTEAALRTKLQGAKTPEQVKAVFREIDALGKK